jgi:hypothetical protein
MLFLYYIKWRNGFILKIWSEYKNIQMMTERFHYKPIKLIELYKILYLYIYKIRIHGIVLKFVARHHFNLHIFPNLERRRTSIGIYADRQDKLSIS